MDNLRENLIRKLDEQVKFRLNTNRILRLLKEPLSLKFFRMIRFFNKINKDFICETFWGDRVIIPVPPFMDIVKYKSYMYDPEVRLQKFIIKHFPENSIFIDIGACFGYYSLLVSTIGNNVQIFSIEADPNSYYYLKTNLNLSKKNNIKIFNIAISEINGKIDFFMPEKGHIGWGTLVKDAFMTRKSNFKKISIQSMTLDYFCKLNNIIPNFIKIDVEGSEYKVIQGALDILQKYKPILSLEIEFDVNNFTFINPSYKYAIQTLQSLGYNIFFIDDNGDINKITFNDIMSVLKDNFLKKKKISFESGYDNLIFIKNI
jgi:FkbM family methyltransferase